MDKEEIDRRVRKVAEMTHLETMLDRIPTELSGGHQQRCAIARALVKDSFERPFEPIGLGKVYGRHTSQSSISEFSKQKQYSAGYHCGTIRN